MILQGTAPLYKFASNSVAQNQFQEDFKIPFARARYFRDASLNTVSNGALFWSSSPDGNSSFRARSFSLFSWEGGANYSSSRATAHSVRCFKDESFVPICPEGQHRYNVFDCIDDEQQVPCTQT